MRALRSFILRRRKPQVPPMLRVCPCPPRERIVEASGLCWRCGGAPSISRDELRREPRPISVVGK